MPGWDGPHIVSQANVLNLPECANSTTEGGQTEKHMDPGHLQQNEVLSLLVDACKASVTMVLISQGISPATCTATLECGLYKILNYHMVLKTGAPKTRGRLPNLG